MLNARRKIPARSKDDEAPGGTKTCCVMDGCAFKCGMLRCGTYKECYGKIN